MNPEKLTTKKNPKSKKIVGKLKKYFKNVNGSLI